MYIGTWYVSTFRSLPGVYVEGLAPPQRILGNPVGVISSIPEAFLRDSRPITTAVSVQVSDVRLSQHGGLDPDAQKSSQGLHAKWTFRGEQTRGDMLTIVVVESKTVSFANRVEGRDARRIFDRHAADCRKHTDDIASGFPFTDRASSKIVYTGTSRGYARTRGYLGG